MTTIYGDTKCPCCGTNFAEKRLDESLEELDRVQLINMIAVLQGQLERSNDQFMRLANLNQKILDQNNALIGR